MKTVRIIIISFLVGLNPTSYDFLGKDPTYTTPENFSRSEAEAISWLAGTYATLEQSSFYGNEFLYLVGGDDLEHYGSASRGPNKSSLTCSDASTSDPIVATLWSTLYAGVNGTNIFLENIDAVPDMNDDAREQYRAEARFLRALYYFTLVEYQGDIPFETTSTEDTYNHSVSHTDKQTVYDFIIKKMHGSTEDFKSAQNLSYLPGRISKSAARGMLARVHMFRAGEPKRDKEVGLADSTADAEITKYFKKASYYAQLVKNEGRSLTVRYWDFLVDIYSDKYNIALSEDGVKANESTQEVEFAGNRSTDVRTENRIGNIIGIQDKDLSSKASIIDEGDPGYACTFIWNIPRLLELHGTNGDTGHYNWNIAPSTYTQSAGEGTPVDGREFVKRERDEVEQRYWDRSFSHGKTKPGSIYGDRESKNNADKNRNRVAAKYYREYGADKKSKNDTSINFPLLRYSDILLIVAGTENGANHGLNDLAYECINAVREYAGINKLAANLDETGFRKAIKDERAMELCFEYTRRFDLVRQEDYHKLIQERVDKAQADKSWKFGTNTYTYFNIPRSYNCFPIPTNKIESNSAIKTNSPGW